MELLINNLDKFLAIIILISSGIYLRFLLELFGQAWIRTKAHTATLLLLPIIVYVITNVIAGNIALSLGMVGALSIVRFRNPVRSPLELASYFCAITLGIAAAVSLQWVMLLIGAVTFGIIVLVILNYISNTFLNRPFFITSFSEGNSLSSLTIVTREDIEILDMDHSLTSKTKSDGLINYTLLSNDFLKLKELENHPAIQKQALTLELRKQ